MPPSTLPKNVIAVLTGAGEPSGRRRSGGLLFHLVCAQETEREELKVLLDCIVVIDRESLSEGALFDLYQRREESEESCCWRRKAMGL